MTFKLAGYSIAYLRCSSLSRFVVIANMALFSYFQLRSLDILYRDVSVAIQNIEPYLYQEIKELGNKCARGCSWCWWFGQDPMCFFLWSLPYVEIIRLQMATIPILREVP